MAIHDKDLERVDQELADMNSAQQRMFDRGLTLGDFDLQAETNRQRTMREEEEAKALAEDPPKKTVGLLPRMSAEEFTKLPPAEQDKQRQLAKEQGERLSRFKEQQSLLNKALFKEQPNVKKGFEEVTKLMPWERSDYYAGIGEGEDYFLPPERVQELLGGEEQYKQYTEDLGYIMDYMKTKYPGTYHIGGKKEATGTVPAHGLRSAALLQYTGDPYTIEEAEAAYDKWTRGER